MTSNYFSNFPEINYNGVIVRDISRRVNFLKRSVNSPYVFLPYTIKENDKAEDIAYHYYGNVNYDWLIYLVNDMIDPYVDWPLDDFNFDQYIILKYKEQAEGRKGWDVVAWAQDETRNDNIVYYYKEVDGMSNIIKISPDSFNTLYLRDENNVILTTETGKKIVIEKIVPEEFKAYRVYDFEKALNENKRNIVLLDRKYLANVEQELRNKLQ